MISIRHILIDNSFFLETINVSIKVHCKGVNTIHHDFVMSSADASIKVTLIYVVYPWHGHCEFLLMQK